jgi:Protein ChrB, N-terminal
VRYARAVSERWLIIAASAPSESSTLRVYLWRNLRGLGAHYLQPSVCLLPERPEVVRRVARLLERVRREGGALRLLHVRLEEPGEEEALLAAFRAERAEEYAEVVSRTPAFLGELAAERARGRVNYAEVEESEADLARLRAWLGKIRARDYFEAPGRAEAEAALEDCARALADFAAAALAAEAPAPAVPQTPAPARRLRAVEE